MTDRRGDFGILDPSSANPAIRAATDDGAIVAALVAAETHWLAVLDVAEGVANDPAIAAEIVAAEIDPELLAERGQAGGNPVIPLVGDLRAVVAEQSAAAARRVHLGLTSQDALDTALILVARNAAAAIGALLAQAGAAIADLAELHAHTVQLGRTLTQPALPISFGGKAAGWLRGVAAAHTQLRSTEFPVQLGGAVGTNAALVELGFDPRVLRADWADRCGLDDPGCSWHTERSPITGIGAALAAVCAAAGHVANDVLLLSRSEIGELSEPAAAGRGASSAMPQKRNPVLSMLIHTAALTAPGQLAQLFLAAGLAAEERTGGAWHSEWPALRELLRLAWGAAAALVELTEGLVVHTEKMSETLAAAGPSVLSERLMTRLAARAPGGRGEVQAVIDCARDRPENLRTEILARIPALDADELELLLDPGSYLGEAPERAIAASVAYRASSLAPHTEGNR
ncbi:MAG: lyase family protein [Segniliparus sp.]|uniref:lyase family protein n=1 Tax=Segniliparus sp. TaxID=2804064 RepID=UPI003F2CE330